MKRLSREKQKYLAWLAERKANKTILDEFRKIQTNAFKLSEKQDYEFNVNWEKGIRPKAKKIRFLKKDKIREKTDKISLKKLEELIALEQEQIRHKAEHSHPHDKENKYGNHLIYKLLHERNHRLWQKKFNWTDKRYQKLVQLNDSFMEAYKCAKAEAKTILNTLKKHKSKNRQNMLLKQVDEYLDVDIRIIPIFCDWDKYSTNAIMNNPKLRFYEALEEAFERYNPHMLNGNQNWSSSFEHGREKGDKEKAPDGTTGPTNWAFEWMPHDSKYYWRHRFCYVMHWLACHTFLSLEDILEIKHLYVKFEIKILTPAH